MNPLAKELNEAIAADNPAVLEMLSSLGKELFMPKGILTQSAEAKEKAHKFNATIGIATEGSGPMYLPAIHAKLSAFAPKDLFPYAPNTGKPELRKLWKEKMVKENPSLAGKTISNPLCTNALTHGLSLVADMFVDRGDYIVLTDKFWGNYNLTFAVRRGGVMAPCNTFTPQGGFDVQALLNKTRECGQQKGKVIVLLNFPNNPSGYTPTAAEGKAIADGLIKIAESGVKIVAVTDDAYFSLFYEDSMTESLFGLIANRSKNLLAIKLDGATKEEFVWGFRVGFITFAASAPGTDANLLTALEKKVAGDIRGTISNCPHPSQTFVIDILQNPEFPAQKRQKFEVLKARALKVKEVLKGGNYGDQFDFYPFNSGYFMCLKLKNVEAEPLRAHLLNQYGVGTISVNKTDLRIAFSSVEADQIQELFDLIYQGCKDLA